MSEGNMANPEDVAKVMHELPVEGGITRAALYDALKVIRHDIAEPPLVSVSDFARIGEYKLIPTEDLKAALKIVPEGYELRDDAGNVVGFSVPSEWLRKQYVGTPKEQSLLKEMWEQSLGEPFLSESAQLPGRVTRLDNPKDGAEFAVGHFDTTIRTDYLVVATVRRIMAMHEGKVITASLIEEITQELNKPIPFVPAVFDWEAEQKAIAEDRKFEFDSQRLVQQEMDRMILVDLNANIPDSKSTFENPPNPADPKYADSVNKYVRDRRFYEDTKRMFTPVEPLDRVQDLQNDVDRQIIEAWRDTLEDDVKPDIEVGSG